MREKIKKHLNLIAIVVLGVFTLLLMWNKFTNNIWEHGHDDYFHISIIRGYMSAFADGNFAVNIVPEVGFNMGYASPMLYPTLMHYLTALLASVLPFSNNIEIACDISFFMNIFLSGVTIYYLSVYLFKNKLVALISAIIYASYPYHLATLFIRFSFSESWIFVFLPILLLGIFKFLREEVKLINIWFIVGLVGCMYSHILTTTFICVILAILLPIYLCFKHDRKIIIKNIKPLLISSLLVLLITAPLYINMFYFRATHELNVFVDGQMGNNKMFLENGLQVGELLYQSPSNYLEYVRKYNVLDFSMPLLVFISLVASILVIWFNKKDRKTLISLVVLMLVVIWFVCLIFPLYNERIIDKINILQFPWRLVNFWALLVALIAPTWLLIKFKYSDLLLILVVASMFIANVGNYYFDCTEDQGCKVSTGNVEIKEAIDDKYKDLINNETVVFLDLHLGLENEYVDKNITDDPELIRQRADKVISLSDNLVNPQVIVNEVPYLKFSVEGDGEGIIGLPRFYYNDYVLKDTEGNVYELFNDRGMLNAKVEANKTYVLEYKESPMITFAKVLRLIGVAVLLIIVVYMYKKSPTKK